jgi:protein-histidine pros-kinase
MLSAELLHRALAGTTDATVIVEESGAIAFANAPACRLLGYAAEELRGQSVELLMPERFRLLHIAHRLRFTDERRTRPMNGGLGLLMRCKDGSERPVRISLAPIQRGLQTLIVAAIRAVNE